MLENASELGSHPKAKISAWQVAAYSKSTTVIYPTLDLRILTVSSCFYLSLFNIGSSC